MANFSDTFTTTQNWNTSQNNSAGVFPAVNTRDIVANNFTFSSSTAIDSTPQTWIFNGSFFGSSGLQGYVRYSFTSSQDFSSMTSFPITVTSSTITGTPITGHFELQLFGSVNFVSVSGNFNANTTTVVDFPTLNAGGASTSTNVTLLQVTLYVPNTATGVVTVQPFASLCFPHDTLVQVVENGKIQEKMIAEIVPGDVVVNGDSNSESIVKRIIVSMASAELVYFPQNSLGNGIPHTDLYSTKPHPIFWKGARRDAYAFVGYNGIKLIANTIYDKLYSLQFDHEGSFFANGVEVQSHSPYHVIMPLPQEFRRIGDLETRVTSDSLNLKLPLDGTSVVSLQF